MSIGPRGPALQLRLALVVASVGVFFGALDQTVVVSALPAMIRDLKVPVNRLDEAAWIVDGYLLGYVAALPLIGRLSDVWGRRPVLLSCLCILLLGSLAAAMANGLWWLTTARVLQAVGGGGLLPVALALATDEREIGSSTFSLGLIGAAAEAGGVAGPLYGGLLADWLGWRWIFWIHIPLVVVLAAATVLFLRPQRPLTEDRHVDWLGATWVAAGLGALTIGLSQIASRHPNLAVPPLVVVALGIALLGAYAVTAYRRPSPIVDIQLLRRRAFAASTTVSLLIGVALIVVMVDIPLLANTVLQRTPLEGALMLLRFSLFLPVGGMVGGLAARRSGNRICGAAGLCAVAFGLLGVSQWQRGVGDMQVARDLAVAGFGFGLLIVPVVASATAAVGPKHAGTATALTHVARVLGMTAGLAVLTSWAIARFETAMATIELPIPRLGESAALYQQRLAEYQLVAETGIWNIYRESFFVAAIVALLALAPLLGMRLPPSRRRLTTVIPERG